MAHKKKILKLLIAPFFFSVSLTLLMPLSVYVQNIDSNHFSFLDILPDLLLFTLLLFIVTSLFTLLISKRLKYFPLMLTAVLAGLWIQGSFINYPLGKLDGHQIIWSESLRFLWIEILAWGVLCVLVILFRKKLLKNNHFLLTFLFLLLTLPNVLILVYNDRDLPEITYLDKTGEFKFSENNVILIILDNFESAAFQTILEESADYSESFKDFIYFQDALGGYTSTKPSIPYLLSGRFYKNQIPTQEYEAGLVEDTISFQLKTQGYKIESYSYEPFFSSIYDNQTDTMPAEEKFSNAIQQTILSGIRYSPLLLKPFFVARYYNGINYVHQDLVTFNTRAQEVEVESGAPRFKLIHLSGAHAPYQLDGNLEWKNGGYLGQAEAALLVVKNLLTEMKRAGVYDSSVIFILGDHGGLVPLGFSTFPLSHHGQPLLLAKKAGQRFEALQISDAPVTLGDIPKTIADETGIDADFPGLSIFEEMTGDRKRYFYFHTWEHQYWSRDYLPTLYEFEVNGLGREVSSWKYLGQYDEQKFISADEWSDHETIDFLMGQ